MQNKPSKFSLASEQSLDPYQLIAVLNKKIKSQSESIQWFKKMYENAEYQKKISLNQLKKKKVLIENLKSQSTLEKQQRKDHQLELEQLRIKLTKIQRHTIGAHLQTKPNSVSNFSMEQSIAYSPYSNNLSKEFISEKFKSNIYKQNNFTQKPMSTQLSIQMKKSDIHNFFSSPDPISRVLQQKNINYPVNNYQQEFVPSDVKLLQVNHKFSSSNFSNTFINLNAELGNQTVEEPISQKPGQFFVEDFLVFGPDVADLKKKRDQDRMTQILQVKPTILYAGNHKTHNQHVYTEIALRCFPFNAKVKRQFVETYQQLQHIIEFMPQNKISSDCLILNLKGQISEVAQNNKCLKRSNLSEMQFIFCVKVPDFVLVSKDEKHYQRAQQQIWIVQKYYAIVSYYPFFDIHLNIITKIHSLLMKEKLNKILVEKEKFFCYDMRKNMLEIEKNQDIKTTIQHFKSFRPDFGEVLFVKGNYFGTIPAECQAQNYIAKLTAPIFMTNFCFEQMLLLLIGVFCEKSIAFISKNEGVATLCALFMIGILTPFPYSFSVLLNVDQQKILPFVFQYPFPMISTIKKTSQNFHQIISSYASARVQKKGIKQESQRMILVDIDTNSIFYQGHQTFQPLIFMGHPGQQFMREYGKINSSYSKSFSFPKKMVPKKQVQQCNKRQQQRNKIIEDIQQTIKSNTTKMPLFEPNEQILQTLLMLLGYVRSFAVEGKQLGDALAELPSGRYPAVLRKYLTQKHPTRGQLIQKIINSQYYADYLNTFADQ